MIEEILNLVQKHEQWRGQECINLIPSENVMSPAVRSILSSDFGHRYTSRSGHYMGTRFTNEIECFGEKLAKQVFKSETADLRALSGHIANLVFLSCFTSPSDKLLCLSPIAGGYPGISDRGIPRFLKLKTICFPFSDETMNIKVQETIDLMLKEKPKAVIFGASLILFPHPVRELAEVAKEIDVHLAYDGSHVMGLIAGGKFQDPLREGASVLFGSTHKSFFGPQGGIMLADREHGEVIQGQMEHVFVDNAHWNRIAALTLALAEMKAYGKEYAEQVIQNSKSLAKTLAEYGFPVSCPSLGYTKSHQVFLNYGGYKQGEEMAQRLEKANIIVDCEVRLGTCEVTRRGMKEKEMEKIAELIKRFFIDKEDPNQVKKDATKLAGEFQEVKYCFENENG